MNIRRHSLAGYKPAGSGSGGEALGTNKTYGANFVDWVDPDAKVKPSAGVLVDGRLKATTDISANFGAPEGTYFAGAVGTPRLQGGRTRIGVVRFETNSSGVPDISPPSFSNLFGAQFTDLAPDNFLEFSYKFAGCATDGTQFISQWNYQDGGEGMSDSTPLSPPLSGNESYWMSTRLHSEGLECSLWDHDPGHLANTGSPMITTNLGVTADFQPLYNTDDLNLVVAFASTSQSMGAASGLKWYPAS